MSFSLYYEAEREKPMTEQEQNICQEIVERYCSQYPFEQKAEDFVVYDADEQTNLIFSGSTKLPVSDPKIMFGAGKYWLNCLTEITNALAHCNWNVRYEDVELIWDPDEGWRFPTNEEFIKQREK